MAAKLCISHQYWSIGIYNYRGIRFTDNIINNKFSINKSGDSEPGEEFENGVKNA